MSIRSGTHLGRPLRRLAETASTNREALAMALEGAAEGTAVAADRQTEGRGRMGRAWFSPPGRNLYVSIILRPADPDPARVATLPLAAGLALAEAVERAAPPLRPLVKWPNDIWVGGKKVCGILCEMRGRAGASPAVVLGFGLNVNLTAEELPPDLSGRATSLRIETGRAFDREAVLAGVFAALEERYALWQAEGLAPLLPELNRRDALRGSFVRMALAGKPLEGVAQGIRPDGALALLGPGGRITPVYSGEAHLGKL